MNGWTQERRERQAELIRGWKPWAKSTGPKSEAGKALASRNSLKHGQRTAKEIAWRRNMNGILKEFRDCESAW